MSNEWNNCSIKEVKEIIDFLNDRNHNCDYRFRELGYDLTHVKCDKFGIKTASRSIVNCIGGRDECGSKIFWYCKRSLNGEMQCQKHSESEKYIKEINFHKNYSKSTLLS